MQVLPTSTIPRGRDGKIRKRLPWRESAAARLAERARPADSGPGFASGRHGPAGASRSLLLVLLVAAGAGLLTVNPLLTATAFLIAALLVVLLWQPGAPPILLFIAGMLWLQPATKALHADALETPVTRMALNPSTIDDAILLSLLATLCVALGMRLVMPRPPPDVMDRLASDAAGLSIGRLGAATVLVWLVAALAEAHAPATVRHLVTATTNLKWAFLFAFACTVLLQRRGYGLLGAITAAQLIAGFTTFFAAFSSVLFLLFIAVLTVRPEIDVRRLPRLAAGVAVIIGFGLVWTAIKSDLREFLNAGTGQQVVLRGPTERLQGLADQLGSLEGETLVDASERLAERLAYVDYFAIVLDRVPLVRPHENGALLGAAIRHVLTPRILFPDKASTGSDSEMTNRYTGLNLASARQGTSINLGWPAEAYIDFGRVFMFLPMLGIGVLCGLVYRCLAGGSPTGILLSYGLAVGALLAVPQAGTLLKLIGLLFANLVVLFALKKLLFPAVSRALRHTGTGM